MSHPRDEHVSVNNNPYVVGGCYDGNKQKVFDGDRFAVLKEFGLLLKAGFRLRVQDVFDCRQGLLKRDDFVLRYDQRGMRLDKF